MEDEIFGTLMDWKPSSFFGGGKTVRPISDSSNPSRETQIEVSRLDGFHTQNDHFLGFSLL